MRPALRKDPLESESRHQRQISKHVMVNNVSPLF